MNLVLLRAAEADIEEAFQWYEARRVGLGHEFVAEVDSAFERALEAPSSFLVARPSIRPTLTLRTRTKRAAVLRLRSEWRPTPERLP